MPKDLEKSHLNYPAKIGKSTSDMHTNIDLLIITGSADVDLESIAQCLASLGLGDCTTGSKTPTAQTFAAQAATDNPVAEGLGATIDNYSHSEEGTIISASHEHLASLDALSTSSPSIAFLLISRDPARSIADAISNAQSLDKAIDAWRTETSAMLSFHLHNRGRSLLIEETAVYSGNALAAALKRLGFPQFENRQISIAESEVDPVAIDISSRWLAQHAEVNRLVARLRACSPISLVNTSPEPTAYTQKLADCFRDHLAELSLLRGREQHNQNQIAHLLKTIDGIQETRLLQRSQIHQLEETIRELDGRFRDRSRELQLANARISELESRLQSAEQQLSSTRDEYRALENQQRALNNGHLKLQDDHRILALSRQKLEEDNESLQKDRQNLQSGKESLERQFHEYQKNSAIEYQTLENRHLELQKDHSTLTESYRKLKGTNQSLQDNLKTQHSDNEALRQRLNEFRNKAEDAAKERELLVQQIRQLESALREFQPKLEPRSEPLPQDTPLSSTAHPPSRRDGFFSKSQRQIRRDAKLIRRSGLMDADWYRANYPDVAEANIDPTYHYLRFGASEGRDPSPEFKTRYYLSTHPDVAATEMNPLVHYLKFGRQEGRAPKKPAK